MLNQFFLKYEGGFIRIKTSRKMFLWFKNLALLDTKCI